MRLCVCVCVCSLACLKRCDDNNGVFDFANGASIHFYFAHKEGDKRIEDALDVHGTAFGDYDMVFANPGNTPHMEPSLLLDAALELQQGNVPLVWLSAYAGEGDIRDWDADQQREFTRRDAKFLSVHDMVRDLGSLTKGYVENERHNPHFCMPGPPNEIGVLLLQLVWSHWATA